MRADREPRVRGNVGLRIGRDRAAQGAITLFVVTTVLCLVGPALSPYSPTDASGPPLLPPLSVGHPLGTDANGFDVLSRVLAGAQVTWPTALVLVLIGVLVGGMIGLVAGTGAGWIDGLLTWATDVFLALPAVLVGIALVAALGQGWTAMIAGLGVVWWPYYARIFRGHARGLASGPNIEAARLAGVGRVRIVWRHILPGVVPSAVVLAGFDVGAALLAVSSLAFLGLGVAPPAAELGADAAAGFAYLLSAPWVCLAPAITIAVLGLIANLAGAAGRRLLREDAW